MTGPAPILVAGVPRSGTTWTAQVVARLAGVPVLHEPDNEKEWASALTAKASLGRFPALRDGDRAPAYETLWSLAARGHDPGRASTRNRLVQRVWRSAPENVRERIAFGPGPRWTLSSLVGLSAEGVPPRRTLVKSVHTPLAVGWVAMHASIPLEVIVVMRHPANVLSSWLRLALPDRDRRLDRRDDVKHAYLDRWGIPPPGREPLARAAWQVCLLTAALQEQAMVRPDWITLHHEDLCRDPVAGFGPVTERPGFAWTDEARAYLSTSDRAGEGFDLHRRAAELPDRWRSALSPPARAALASVWTTFPHLEHWAGDLEDLT